MGRLACGMSSIIETDTLLVGAVGFSVYRGVLYS